MIKFLLFGVVVINESFLRDDFFCFFVFDCVWEAWVVYYIIIYQLKEFSQNWFQTVKLVSFVYVLWCHSFSEFCHSPNHLSRMTSYNKRLLFIFLFNLFNFCLNFFNFLFIEIGERLIELKCFFIFDNKCDILFLIFFFSLNSSYTLLSTQFTLLLLNLLKPNMSWAVVVINNY